MCYLDEDAHCASLNVKCNRDLDVCFKDNLFFFCFGKLVCQDRIIVNSDPAYYNDLVAFCKNTTKIIQIQGGVIVVNKWIRKMGMSLSVIMAAAQMSGAMVYAAPETEEQGSFLEEEQDLPKVENVDCMIEQDLTIRMSWDPVERTIGDEKVSPDYYEVYVNHDKDKSLEEQRKEGTPIWKLCGKTTTNTNVCVNYDENWKPGDIYNLRVCAVYDGEIYAVSDNVEWIIPGYDPGCTITDILVEQESYQVLECHTIVVNIELRPSDLNPVEIAGWLIWESSNEKIATVKPGRVSSEQPMEIIITGVKFGRTTIKGHVINGDAEVTIPVTVRAGDDWWMKMDRRELFLREGDTGLKTAYADYWDDPEVEWRSEDETIATVEVINEGRSAIIHALRPGTTTVTVGVPGVVVTDRCTVTVSTDKPVEDAKRDEPDMVREPDGTVYVVMKDGSTKDHFTGMADYEGGKFLMVEGAVAKEANGAQLDPVRGDIFYFLANGQVQYYYEGLAEYDGEWFYIKDGAVQTQMNALVDYDGGKFLVAVGRIVDEYNGLAQDPQNTQTGDWYYFADGQAQTQYTGLVRYDNAWFYVINGKLAADFNGSVDYDGATFRVENGMVK